MTGPGYVVHAAAPGAPEIRWCDGGPMEPHPHPLTSGTLLIRCTGCGIVSTRLGEARAEIARLRDALATIRSLSEVRIAAADAPGRLADIALRANGALVRR